MTLIRRAMALPPVPPAQTTPLTAPGGDSLRTIRIAGGDQHWLIVTSLA
jgi:hypothetical protein